MASVQLSQYASEAVIRSGKRLLAQGWAGWCEGEKHSPNGLPGFMDPELAWDMALRSMPPHLRDWWCAAAENKGPDGDYDYLQWMRYKCSGNVVTRFELECLSNWHSNDMRIMVPEGKYDLPNLGNVRADESCLNPGHEMFGLALAMRMDYMIARAPWVLAERTLIELVRCCNTGGQLRYLLPSIDVLLDNDLRYRLGNTVAPNVKALKKVPSQEDIDNLSERIADGALAPTDISPVVYVDFM